jgi:hypothetical protein
MQQSPGGIEMDLVPRMLWRENLYSGTAIHRRQAMAVRGDGPIRSDVAITQCGFHFGLRDQIPLTSHRFERVAGQTGDGGVPDETTGPQADIIAFRRKLPREYQSLSDVALRERIKEGATNRAGVHDPDLANRFLSQAGAIRGFGESTVGLEQANLDAISALNEFSPSNIAEAMLATQMVGVHESAISFLRAAGRFGLSEKQRNGELRRAREQMQLFIRQVDTMLKLKELLVVKIRTPRS